MLSHHVRPSVSQSDSRREIRIIIILFWKASVLEVGKADHTTTREELEAVPPAVVRPALCANEPFSVITPSVFKIGRSRRQNREKTTSCKKETLVVKEIL